MHLSQSIRLRRALANPLAHFFSPAFSPLRPRLDA
jgi:hypothetical protein